MLFNRLLFDNSNDRQYDMTATNSFGSFLSMKYGALFSSNTLSDSVKCILLRIGRINITDFKINIDNGQINYERSQHF